MLSPEGFPKLPSGWSTSRLQAELHTAVYANPSGPSRALFVVHGQGEHGGRYLHVPALLGNVFGSVATVDLQGHGQSSGKRGHIDHFDDYTRAVIRVLKIYAQSLKPGTSLFVLGHSMGGLVGLRMGILDQGLGVRAFVISAPLLKLSMPVPKIKEAFGRLMANVFGTLSLTNGIDVTKLSHDRAVQRAYLADPLNHNKVTPRFFVELEKAMADTRQVQSFSYPVMVIVAGSDEVVSTPAVKSWYTLLRAPQKQLFEVVGGRHESLNEGGSDAPPGVDKFKVAEEISKWIRTF